MGPDPDPAPDPEPLHVPNPNPDPQPLPEDPMHADALMRAAPIADTPTRSRRFALRFAAGALAIGGAIVACYNEVPGPQGPLPSPAREVPPQGPKPGPLVPAPHLIPPLDAGLPVPTPEGRTPNAAAPSSSSAHLTVPAGAPLDQHANATDTRIASHARVAQSHARVAQTTSSPSRSSDGPSSDPPPPTEPPQQQPPGSDAGVVDSPADLPPDLPDAGPIASADAGQPLAR
jgi:hypothetical protein